VAPWDQGETDHTVLSWDHLFELLTGEGGYLARIPAGTPPVLVLTQMNELEDSLGLFGFLDRVMSEADVPIIVLGELQGEPPRFRTAYRTAGEEHDDGGT
jgi:hypothetical protein